MNASLKPRCRSLLPQKKIGKAKRNSKNKIRVKTKQIRIVRGFFGLRIKKSIKYQAVLVLLFVALFVFSALAMADEERGGLIVNEIQFQAKGHTDYDYIEIYNTANKAIDLGDYNLYKMTSSGTSYSIKSPIANKGTLIESKKYYTWASSSDKNFPATIGADVSTAQTIADKNAVAILRRSDGAIVDGVGWGDISCGIVKYCESKPFLKIVELENSIGRINAVDSDDNGDDFNIQNPTPGKENKKIEEKIIEKKTYSTGVSITELFPNPFQSQYEEYIELYNGTLEDIDLIGWTLHDASKSGKYTFAQSVILKAQKYLAVFKKDFKFALNNSGNESVVLFDPNGIEISKASYDGSKRNVSYNFDGSRWRQSKFLTPGTENILNNEPRGTVKIDDEIFENAYANFSVSTGDADGDTVKVAWDFGDGHKSYLAKTRHKYESAGTYNGSVKLSDGSEDVIKTFVAEVKKFPHPKVKIISINANPVGSDTLGESLVIENKSKKKINLEGWSIATGSKTLANHPITEKFVLKKKESREITREISKFTLNNKKGKIELRYPDGEVADKIKYNRGKISIEDGEKYVKTKSGWSWAPVKSDKVSLPTAEFNGVNSLEEEVIENIKKEGSIAEVAGVEIIKKEYSYVMVENNIVIGKIEFKNSDARVTGIKSVREINGQYLFIPPSREREHYAVIFFKNISSNMNTKLNLLLNYFVNS